MEYPRILKILLVSAATVSALAVYSGRPRIYFGDAGGHALTVTQQQARAQSAPFLLRRGELSAVTTDTGYYDMVNNALKYRLYDDTAAARRALTLLLECRFTEVVSTYESVAMREAAVTFDWLWSYPPFTAQLKRQVASALKDYAVDCVDYLYSPFRGAHIFHTRTSGAIGALGTIALSIHGEDASARQLLDTALFFWDSIYTPARLYLDGALGNGMTYGSYHGVRSDLLFLAALWSASDRRRTPADIEAARRESEYFIRNIRPDMGWTKKDDISEFMYMTFGQTRCLADLFSGLFQDGQAAHLSDLLGQFWGKRDYAPIRRTLDNTVGPLHGSYLYVYFLWKWDDPQLLPPDHFSLDLCAVHGQNSVGHVFLRSGWGREDLSLFYKCGDYIEDHGHFDQGQFSLFLGAPLVTKVGQWNNKTSGCASTLQFSPWDVQRRPSYQSASDLEDYFRVKDSLGLETGDITAFVSNDSFAYVASDLTRAHFSGLCSMARRDLFFIRNRAVLLFDQYVAVADSAMPRSYLYTPKRPVLNGRTFRFENSDLAGNRYRLDGRVLLPEHPVLAADSAFAEPATGAEFRPLTGLAMIGDDTLEQSAAVFGWRLSLSDSAAPDTGAFMAFLVPYPEARPLAPAASIVDRTRERLTVAVDRDTLYFRGTGGIYTFDTSRVIGVERTPAWAGLATQGIRVGPNPFTSSVRIRLAKNWFGEEPRIRIFDARGRLVTELTSSAEQGVLEAVWNGRDVRGGVLPNGVYLAAVRDGKQVISEKILLLR